MSRQNCMLPEINRATLNRYESYAPLRIPLPEMSQEV